MKKFFLASTILIITSYIVSAQEVNFGIKAGYNSSSIEITEGDDYESKSGLHVGGLAHIHISPHFAVQPELVLSCQGGERNDNYKLRTTYLNLPVLGQYMIGDGFRLQTGPQIGFLLTAEEKFGDVEVDIDDQLSTVDVSWVFGASYIFASGIGIDARYNLGLNDISDNKDYTAKNRVLQIGLFYQFRNNANRKK